MDDEGMSMDELEQALKENPKVAFIYTIADFQNPMGASMSIPRRKRLVELAQTYDTFVVEDAPYSLISFDGTVMPAIKSFDTYGRVIYSGSTSKTIAPGLRIGWLAADEESIQKLVYLKMRDDLQVNNMAQRQVLHYLRDCDFDGHLRQVIEVYKRRKQVMIDQVMASFPKGTRVVPSGGGLFLWVELPEGVDTMEMFDFVFQKNIAYVPGQFFCTDGSGKNAMRLNFSTASEEMIAKNIPILGEMIVKYLEK